MKKVFFIVQLMVSSLVVSFVLTLLYAAFIGKGDEAMGIGMLWYYSLPALVLLSTVFALTVFNWHNNASSLSSKGIRLFSSALVVSIFSPFVTYFVFWVRA